MGLTQVSKDGVKNDAIDASKLPANSVGASELADNAVDTNAIADQAVALSKLPHGDGSSNGKFLRANNGADPTFESIPASGISNLVEDTTPQLGGDLSVNGNVISFGDSSSASDDRLKFGNSNDLVMYHDGTNNYISTSNGYLFIVGDGTNSVHIKPLYNEESIVAKPNGAVELYYDNGKVFETGSSEVKTHRRIQIHADAPGSGHGMSIGQWDGSNHRIEGDANRPLFLTAYNSGGIKMGVGGANKVAVNSHGLTFNGDTAAANALDDYEEGTYTPTALSGGTGANTDGMYTKIGNFCIVAGSINFDQTGSGMCGFTLPFTAAGGRTGSGVIRYSNRVSANEITFHVNAGAAHVSWYQFGGGSYTYGDAQNYRFDFVITYITA